MTTYSLVDVFSYTDDELREILEVNTDVNESRRMLINKLLISNKLDLKSLNIVNNSRFWTIFDMSDEELSLRSDEDSRLNKILDVLGTEDSIEVLDRPILYEDILANILLNTIDLKSIMNFYQSSKLYKDLLNKTHFLRQLASNIKSRLIEYIGSYQSTHRTEEIDTYQDFIEWYVEHYYVQDALDDPYLLKLILSKIIKEVQYNPYNQIDNQIDDIISNLNINNFDDFVRWINANITDEGIRDCELLKLLSNMISNGYTEDSIRLLDYFKGRDKVIMNSSLPPTQILSLLTNTSFDTSSMNSYGMFYELVIRRRNGYSVGQDEIDAAIEIFNIIRKPANDYASFLDISTDYPELFVALYNYLKSINMSDEQMIQSLKSFHGNFGTDARLTNLIKSLKLTVWLDRVSDIVTGSLEDHIFHSIEYNNTDSVTSVEDDIELARSSGVDNREISRIANSLLNNIVRSQSQVDYEPIIIALNELKDLILSKNEDMYKNAIFNVNNAINDSHVSIPTKTWTMLRFLKRIKKNINVDTDRTIALIDDSIAYLELKEDIPLIKSYLASLI